MKKILTFIFCIVTAVATGKENSEGTIVWHQLHSKVFPGTVRQYGVYVPKSYNDKKEAAVMIYQDGHAYANPQGEFKAIAVTEELMKKRDMPLTVSIFINPGVFSDSDLSEPQGWDKPKELKANRSVEYDSLNGDYAKMLETEILPEVEKTIQLSHDPSMRGICGMSSGGICAFTVAWQRPDLFRKVLSHVGSFTNIRGGDVYPGIIRRTETKPIRVFLQDGKKDLDNICGNWFLGNQQMDAALRFKNYDYQFVITEGGHSGKDGGEIFTESLKWLWRKEEKK